MSNINQNKRVLTEKQEKFLEYLFQEAKGDPLQAKRMAGYSENVGTASVVNSLQEEIGDYTRKFISSSATKAAYSIYDILSNPTELGNKEKMMAAKDILDRGGFGKIEKIEVTATTPLFILPAKASSEVEEEEQE